MAAPPEKTLHDLNGSWIMNKGDSGDTNAVLALQSVGWILRKTIGLATVTLKHKQFKDEEGVTHVEIDQVINPGLQGTREIRVLNYEWRDHKDMVFGAVKGRSQWVKIEDLPDDEDGKWLKEGWDEETTKGGELIQSYVESYDNGWTADQTWGFETLKGERRYARHVVVKDKTGKKVLRIKIFYDWAGPLPEEQQE